MSFWNLGFRVVLEEKPEIEGSQEAKARRDLSTSRTGAGDSAFPPTDADAMLLFRQAMFSAQQQQWDSAIEDLEKAQKIYEKRIRSP